MTKHHEKNADCRAAFSDATAICADPITVGPVKIGDLKTGTMLMSDEMRGEIRQIIREEIATYVRPLGAKLNEAARFTAADFAPRR